jgi:hypothetical protein
MVDYVIAGGNNYTVVDLGDPDPLTEFPEIFGNENFSYVVSFTQPDATDYLGITVNSKPDWVSATAVSNNQIWITRDPAYTIFPGEAYVLTQYPTGYESETVTTVTPGEWELLPNKEDYILNSWTTPSQEEVSGSYSFTLSYEYLDEGSPTTASVGPNYTQNYVWNVQNALPGFINSLDQSMPPTDDALLNEYANTDAPFDTSNTFTSTTELKDLLANTGIDPTELDNARP